MADTASMLRMSLFQPGRSIILPVNLSRYQTTGVSCPSAQRFRSGYWLAVFWDRLDLLTDFNPSQAMPLERRW